MDSAVTKIQKHVDGLKAKNDRLAADNAKLKEQLATAKSINSRIRRIAKPKGGKAEDPAAPAAVVEQQ